MSAYSRLLSWEVWNFMSIQHAKCEFDEKNIINLKGYNDSGKSAMLTALKVLLTNTNPNKQVEFIQDGADYFRIIAVFDDGIMILRDKYINGQSLYEMYKGNEVLYSTKQKNGALSRVTAVPEPIAEYLGLITYEDTCLNARACFEKQIGVQTTGSENYKMFNTVLKSEEIASAASMLNNDKNKLINDINTVEAEINANKSILGVGQYITLEMIDYLEEHDSILDGTDLQLSSVSHIVEIKNAINSIVILPELTEIDNTELRDLELISNLHNQLCSISVLPEMSLIDTTQLDLLSEISSLKSNLDSVIIVPSVPTIDLTQLKELEIIQNIVREYNECCDIIKEDDKKLEVNSQLIEQLEKELADSGVNYVKCPGCGHIFNPDEAHVH